MKLLRYFGAVVLSVAAFCVTATAQDAAELPKLKSVSSDRIKSLPPAEQPKWNAYVLKSQEFAAKEREQLANEVRVAGKSQIVAAPGAGGDFKLSDESRDVKWLRSDAARELAQVILSYQTPTGGWSKAVNYSKGPRQPGTHWTSQSGAGWHYCGTIDNGATTQQIEFLARHFATTDSAASRDGALKGIEWLLAAQYPSGGWPQVYPLEPGYHEAITLNDNAMTHVLELLMLVGKGESPYEFADPALRERANAAVTRGLDCLARCQVVIDGQRSVWCAQHDPIDLKPMAARLKEPPSLSGAESAELVKFLMRKADDTPQTRMIIESAVKWLDAHRITNLRKTKNDAGKTDYVVDDATTEVYWARFYDLETQKPIFAGAEDGIIYDTYSEMAKNNKVGYDYFTTKPRDVVTKELQRWKKRVGF